MTPQEYDDKIKKLSQYETFCVIPVFVMSFLHQKPIDEAHAVLSMLFRLAVALLGLAAIIGFEVWKFILRREAKALRQAAPPVAEDVRYPRV